MARRGSRGAHLLMLCGSVLLAVSLWRRHALPAPDALDPLLFNEPRRQAIYLPPFDLQVDGVSYTIKPRTSYQAWGLVVSRHDARVGWGDGDAPLSEPLNVMDWCVVFAEDAEQGAYAGLDYSSGPFQCRVQAHAGLSPPAFALRALTHHHLLTADLRVADQLRAVQVGDQVHISGYVPEPAHAGDVEAVCGSTGLTGAGAAQGACETVYVQSVQVLHEGGRPWRVLVYPAVGLIVLALARWLRAPG